MCPKQLHAVQINENLKKSKHDDADILLVFLLVDTLLASHESLRSSPPS